MSISIPPANSEKPQRSTIAVIVIVIILVQAVFLIWRLSSWYYDDPFITYRYAWNLIHGLGFVYNPGERVLSTTTPFFTILLAGFGLIWPNFPLLATVIGCLAAVSSGLLFWDLAKQWKMEIAAWVGLLLLPIFPLVSSTISSETPLYIALVLGTLDLYVRRRFTLAGLTSAILVLVRPDGILLPLLLAIVFLLKKNEHRPWGAVGIFIGINALWFGFAWLYFGSPIPMTLLSKHQQGVMSISQQFAPGFVKIISLYSHTWYFLIEALLAMIGAAWLIIRRHASSLLVIWTMFYFLAYSLLGVTRYFWYYAPLVPAFILLTGGGFEMLVEVFNRIKGRRDTRKWLARLLFIVLAILSIFQGINTYNFTQTPDKRIFLYRSVGEWLHENTQEKDQIGMLEVGIIGYYSERSVIDFAGLIQPEVARQMRADTTYEDTARWAIETFHPSYLVLSPEVFPELINDYAKEQCSEVQYFNAEKYQAIINMVIFKCE